jgi:hypothetical protein
MAEYRQAIEVDPRFPEPHCNLGIALQSQGRFAEALEMLRRGHQLGLQTPGWRYPTDQWVRGCEQLLARDEKLSAVLRGDATARDGAEFITLAAFCKTYKRRNVATVRLCADAFAADPSLAADLRQQHRYNAACCAALAAAGQGEDAKNLPDKVQLMLRLEVLLWLRADLGLYAKQAARNDPAASQTVRQMMQHWQKDSDLASVRDQNALDRMPDDERQAWRQLWEDVAALLKRVAESK